MTKSARAGLAVAVAAALTAPAAFATNGYFSHGYSIKEKGLVGAGVALPQDSLAAATNPAGMVMVGNRMDAGVSLFSPRREYEVSGAPSIPPGSSCPTFPSCPFSLGTGTVESDANLFLIPSFGWNKMLDADSSFGISIYGNGGMNTRYADANAAAFAVPPTGTVVSAPGTYGGGLGGHETAGVDLAQLFFNLSYARKITPTSSWGVSGILAYQQFEARGLSAFSSFSTAPTKLTDNGHDNATGLGAKIGIQGEVAPGVALAGSYQTKINMSEFDEYKGLFAGDGDFDIPPTATVGVAWKLGSNSAFTADVQKIWYSEIDSVGNSFQPAFNNCAGVVFGGGSASSSSSCLGGSNGAGFGWDDMTVYKIGYQWQTGSDWVWRVGYSIGDQPIPDSEVLFNILAPAVMEQHVTFGFTTQTSKSSELTFAAMYAPEEEIKGANPLDPAQEITLRMRQYELAASWGWKF